MRHATALMARARLSLAIAKADVLARRSFGLTVESDAEVAQARRRMGLGTLQVVQWMGRGTLQVVLGLGTLQVVQWMGRGTIQVVFQVVQIQVVHIQVVFQMVRWQVVAYVAGLWWTLPAWGSAVYK